MTTPISELDRMTEMEKLYRINERLEDFYGLQGDWKNVMTAKWGMLIWTGGN